MRSISNLFGASPFVPLQEHMSRVMETVDLLKPFFEALADGDKKNLAKIAAKINKSEHEADKVKNRYRGNMPKGLFLPVPRSDLLALMSTQDGMADYAQDVAELVTLRDTEVHPDMRKELTAFLDQVAATSKLAADIVGRLDELLESSFGGGEAARVLSMCDALNKSEHDADVAQRETAKKIFEMEEEIGAVSIMMWSSILTRLGGIANRAENIGNHLRMMLANN